MGNGFSNPLVGGGGSLVYPSIHSPDFTKGPPAVGWSINKDGTAEFTGVTLTGGSLVIDSAGQGVFLYSGTPTFGNLITSIANAADTDAYGNAYLKGVTSYAPDSSSGLIIATNLTTSNGLSFWSASTMAGPWGQASEILASGATGLLNLYAGGNIILAAGSPPGFNVAGQLILSANAINPVFEDSYNENWTIGRKRTSLTAPFNVTSPTLAAIGGMTAFSLGGGNQSYHLRMKLWGSSSAVNGVMYTPGFLFNGVISSFNGGQVNFLESGGSGSAPVSTQIFGVTTPNGFGTSPPSNGVSHNCWTEVEADIVVTAGGVLTPACLTSTAGDQFHILPGSFLEISA